jgi:hypothetical protein
MTVKCLVYRRGGGNNAGLAQRCINLDCRTFESAGAAQPITKCHV